MLEREQLEKAIAAQEALRPTLGDSVVDATISVLRERLSQISAARTPEQRRQVTILFADTVASTAMSEKLDPEDVLEIMDGALKAYTDAVNEAGGTVARLMGDGVLAFFGAPIGREDDPIRAVRCGLAITRAARQYASIVEARWGVSGFSVRIGINSGMVALGEVGGAAGSEWTAMGDTINLASRLESAAPPGTVLISHDTFLLVRGAFEIRAIEPLQVKGKSETVSVYVVEREKPRTFRAATRGVEGIETRMVGREPELRQMQNIFNWAMEENETQAVTIVGEPGVGKSRLLREFDNWLDELPEMVLYFTGRATVEMSNTPYGLIRNVFAFRFDIQDSDSAATAREKLERGITGFLGAESARRAHAIGHLIGFDFASSPFLVGEDPQQLTQLGIYYMTDFFGTVSARTPTVIFLDDIQWADDKSLDLINHIVRSKRQLKLMVVCLARTMLFERRGPIWTDRQEFHTTIELRPLSRKDSLALVDEILRKAPSVPGELLDRIVNTADGNPFYVEELIKMLIEDGVIVTAGDRWWVDTGRLAGIRIPPTITGVLQARLDALPPAERIVLQRASVIGRIFWDSAVAHLHADGEEPVDDVEVTLRALLRRDLIREREQSAFSGTHEYIIRHTILRDVTYENVLRRQRRMYHAQVADWLVERSGDRLSEYSSLIAEHYERAEQPEKAVAFLSQAAEQALLIGAYRETIQRIERALALIKDHDRPEDQKREAQLKWQLGQAHRGLSDYGQAELLIHESLSLFKRVGDQEGIVRALYELGWLVGSIMRKSHEGEQYFEESLKLAREIGDKRGVAWALNGLGAMAHLEQRPEDALRYYEESKAIGEEIGDWSRVAGAYNNLGLAKVELGRREEAGRDFEKSMELFREAGNRVGLASPLINLGRLARTGGLHEEARYSLTEGLSIYRETGNRAGVVVALEELGNVARQEGEYKAAHELFEEALSIAREIQFPAGIGSALEDLALIARLQGKYDEAQQALREILALSEDLGDPNESANALLNLSNLARARGQIAEARELGQRSLETSQQIGNRRLVARALHSLAETASAMGEHDEARQHYQESLAIYREYGIETGIILNLGGLGEVAAETGDYETARHLFHEAFTDASRLRDTPLTLWILAGIGSLLAREGERERSLELLGLVLHHYGSPQEARDKAQRVMETLKGKLKDLEFNSALERGKGLAQGADQRRLALDDTRWMSLLA